MDLKSTGGRQTNQNCAGDVPSYRITILGCGSVGKTSLLLRMTQNEFLEGLDPTISDEYLHHFVVNGTLTKLTIRDTAGQESYKVMREQYTRTAQGFLIVYSVSDQSSFDAVERIYEDIVRIKNVDSFPCVVLVGNKDDLVQERTVMPPQENELKKKLRFPLVTTSAKTNLNVELAFRTLVSLIQDESARKASQQAAQPQRKTNAQRLRKCTLL